MNDASLTTEERLYSLSKQKLWDHVAQEQNRSMLESEEYDLWLVATESLRVRVAELEKDKERLDWVEKQSDGSRWVARQSVTGRGFRLHNTEILDDSTRGNAREAIDAAIAAQKGKDE